MVPAERNVTVAVGHGKAAAWHIDAWLRGERYVAQRNTTSPVSRTSTPGTTPTHQNRASDARHHPSPVDLRRSPGRTRRKTPCCSRARCLSCGNCFECDNCYGVCPDNAVIKLGPGKRFQFNYDYCKGCGYCVAECPVAPSGWRPKKSERRQLQSRPDRFHGDA